MYVLICAWDSSGCDWNDAPGAPSIFAYVAIPCLPIAGIFIVADANFLGTRVGAFVKSVVGRMRSTRRVEYWIMESGFRDFVVWWIGNSIF